MIEKRKIILLSASKRRFELLDKSGIFPIQINPNFDERSIDLKNIKPMYYPKLLALEKMRTYKNFSKGVIISADTCVIFNNIVINKPSSVLEANDILLKLKGLSHKVITAIVVKIEGKIFTVSKTTKVTLRNFSCFEIKKYIESGLPFDRAGGYGIQDLEFSPVIHYKGCYLNVVGLPMCALASILSRFDISINKLDCKNDCNDEKIEEVKNEFFRCR